MSRWSRLSVHTLEDRLAPANIAWIGGGPGDWNSWANPANWQGGLRPHVGDTAVFGVTASTWVHVDMDAYVDGVVFDAGWNQWMTLDGILGTTLESTWNRGSIFDGTGYWDNVGTISLAGDPVALVGATLENRGKLQIQNAYGLDLNYGASIVNDLGTIDFQSDGDINSPTSGGSGLSNTGQIKKTGGVGVSEVTTFINNSPLGSWDAKVGTLIMRNAGGANTGGKFYASKDATLDVSGGYGSTWEGIYQGGGEGNIVFNAGGITIGPAGADFAIDHFQWGNGEINGNTLTNHGTIDITGGFALLNGPNAVLNNLGTINHWHNGNFNMSYGAKFNNANSSSVFDFKADGDFYHVGSGGQPAFTNKGLVRKSGGTGVSLFAGPAVSSLGGVWEAQTGTLEIDGNNGSHIGGFFNAAAGATIDIAGYSPATWEGEFQGTGPGMIVWNGGTMTAGPSGVKLDFQQPNLFHWKGGAIVGGIVHNAGTINIDGSFVGVDGATAVLRNTGIINHITSDVLYMANGSNFLNQGGIYDFKNNGSVYYNGTGATPTFVNAGLLRKSGGTGTSYVNGSFVVNTGTVDIATGFLDVPAPLFMDMPSYLIGYGGLWDGVINKAGYVRPGSSVAGFSTALLTVYGPYMQSDTGELQIDIAGTTPGVSHDQLVVNNSVSLGGILRPQFGYVPQANEKFVVLANDGNDPIAGTFSGLPEGQSFSVNGVTMTITYKGGDGNDVELTVQSAVPLPPAKVTNVRINNGAAQRSRVTALEVTFDQVVNFTAYPGYPFLIRRQSDNVDVGGFYYVTNTPTTVVTFDFAGPAVEFGSLTDGRYTLTVVASFVNNGNFDGNGDGSAGDDYQLVGTPANGLFRLFGDANGDGTVNGATSWPSG